MDEILEKFIYDDNSCICGLTSELDIFYIVNYFNKINENIIVLTSTLYEANKYYNLIQTHTNNCLLFPCEDFLTSELLAESPELKFTRLETIQKIKNAKNIIVTNLMGYLKYISKNACNKISLKTNDNINREKLINELINFGYKKETIVTSTGEFATRGLVIDIFPINYENPVRMEFDDDFLESLRYFDENTQLSKIKTNKVDISPVGEVSAGEVVSLADFASVSHVIYIEYEQIKVNNRKLAEDIFNYQTGNSSKKLMFDLNDFFIKHELFLNKINTQGYNYNSEPLINYNSNYEKLIDDVNKWYFNNKKIYFCLSKKSQIDKIRELKLPVQILNKKINNGFIIDNIVVIGDKDIENTEHNLVYKSNYKFGKRLKDYSELEKGDYVVHPLYGIGIYNGLVTLEKNGVKKDYIQILYAQNDKIYVPATKINNIYKYKDKEGYVPKINSLNSSTWYKTKKNIEAKVNDISEELIKLYNERLLVKRKPYSQFEEEELFLNSFDYDLTFDQKKALKEIKNDFQKDYPMDRLLCGDVGFGKSEVAYEAMFSVVLNNKQAMYLCPTTILSMQQYKVALKRFKDWPINIALLNRHTSLKETKSILEKLKKGGIDILFGTHRILSDDIQFKDLSLLVIDEEQRFGVAHKEKIKKLKNDIDVLTLSATPIPRTLKMALSGLRDLSIIDTAPINRYPVQTYVAVEDEYFVKDAIYKELSRNGQVFILFNSVDKLENFTEKIKKLVPDAKVNYAHGQMNKIQIETIMENFVNKEYDVLICTTIIENGIDIPNANTLIVYDADHFGLSQLYQLRGRVGRSNKIGYAYLLYKKDKIINETAIKRLEAIKEFTSLGSGYKIAMRDLSIRGAGDVFGASQAGFIDSVGLNYYLKLMDDAIKKQKGERVIEENNKESLLNVSTSINDDYVNNEAIKIEIHQKLSEIDSLETLEKIKKELEDRFGKLDDNMIIYMYEELFSFLAEKLEIVNVKDNERFIELELSDYIKNNINDKQIFYLTNKVSLDFNITNRFNKTYITLYKNHLKKHYVFYLIELLEEFDSSI